MKCPDNENAEIIWDAARVLWDAKEYVPWCRRHAILLFHILSQHAEQRQKKVPIQQKTDRWNKAPMQQKTRNTCIPTLEDVKIRAVWESADSSAEFKCRQARLQFEDVKNSEKYLFRTPCVLDSSKPSLRGIHYPETVYTFAFVTPSLNSFITTAGMCFGFECTHSQKNLYIEWVSMCFCLEFHEAYKVVV